MAILRTLLVVALASANLYLGASESPRQEWHELKQANKTFVRNPHYAKERAGLVKGQNPRCVVLCCSDSRVPPELVFDQGLGELFVARIAGQVADDVVIDSIDFAVHNYDVSTLVVMGHEGCGAVKGALERLRKNN